MAGIRYLLVLSLAVLLLSRPLLSSASADYDEDSLNEFGGEEEGEEGVDDGEFGSEADMDGAEEAVEIPDGDDGDVIALNNETLAEKVATGKPILLEFYAPWCGHCKAIAPEMKAAAAILKEFDVTLAKVDATKHEALAGEYGIEGYPSLLWIVGSNVRQYSGGRAREEIVSWVKKRIGFAVTTLSSVENAKKALEEQSAIVAGYFKDLTGKDAAAFADSGKDADDVEYMWTNDVAVASALGLPTDKPSALAVVKKTDDKFVAFEGPYEADNITQFVMANRLPLFVTFSDDTAQLVFGGSIKRMVFFFFPDAEYDGFMTQFAPVARDYKGKAIFIYVNSTDEDMDNVREFFGVTVDTTTALGFSTEKREDGEKFAMETELNLENLKVFVDDFMTGKAKAFFKSEKIPEKNDGPVTVVVGNNFEDIVLDDTKDVLLEVYAPWCGHCKALEPTYKKLGEKFQGIGSVVIAKMDGTANEHPDVKVEGFPTILFYPAKNKSNPVPADAARKLSALAEFIQEHASIPFELPTIQPEDEADEAEGEEEAGEEEDMEMLGDELAEEDEVSTKDEL